MSDGTNGEELPGVRVEVPSGQGVQVGDQNIQHNQFYITQQVVQPPYRLEGLADRPAALSREQARAQPSRMLLARYEIVPFTGRGGFLLQLSEWLQAAAPVSVRLVYGSGGEGKSRLAMHFARECASGWTIFQARRGPVPSQGRNRLTIPKTAAGLLVIVDYADR